MRKPNWTKRLAIAARRSAFTPDDVKKAESWMTCAVGEHSLAEREALQDYFDSDGLRSPRDEDLFALGYAFYDYVCKDAVDDAQRTYGLIQEWFTVHLAASR